jgi:outer membrane protein insertion porin family
VPRRLLFAACFLALVGSLSAQTWPPTTKPSVRRVIFENAALLPAHVRQEITKETREARAATRLPEEEVSDMADEACERVRAEYQDEGYFKVQVTAKAVPVAKDPMARYDIVIWVLEEGKQYRLGDLRVIHMTVFSEQQLRDLFPIQRGEIFSREKIAKGLEELRRLYGSEGYIDFLSVPNTTLDEESSTIALEIDVHEGRVFQWGDLHIAGMRDQDQQLLLQAWSGVRGQPYHYADATLQRFFRRFFRPLRKGTTLTDYTTVQTNSLTGTVDVYLSLTLDPALLKSVGK